MRAHLTPVIGPQPLPWPHKPTEMGENADEVRLSMRGGSWFMSRLKANWTDEERAAESLRRQNEVLASKIKREAMKAKSLLGIVAMLLTTTSIIAAEYDETRAPSPTSLVGENLSAKATASRPRLASLKSDGVQSNPTVRASGIVSDAGSNPAALNLVTAHFLNAVAMVESSGNPRAIGDGGLATGTFQLHAAARIDARKLLGRDGTDRELARAYFQWLQARFVKRYGKQPTYAELYQAYNRGFGNAARDGFDLSKAPVVTQKAVKKLQGLL